MSNTPSNGIKRGQAITFRLPSDTPDHIIRELQKIKEAEKRNFSSKIAEFVLESVGSYHQSKDRETITVPLPKGLSKEQRNWIRHSHSEALLGNIVYQLLSDPVRATAILASMNSTSLDIDEALYLQEKSKISQTFSQSPEAQVEEAASSSAESAASDDDLMNFDWDSAMKDKPAAEEKKEDKVENIDDLLGGFLDRMNK
ncbi:hypothetical protein [Jeotgalibacillus proteolyticus]|uniref:Uncharacterized protein n=1 Tax=Jeotgalibacillus proteolyticus TaxID=2082395 RepID=A0A2S5G8E5_9BACL|nr:hypothetical protein [Jeotgalibacillus proteolyticus]PPA69260.1 hypothetical protein C4B60_15765 [Jeotgalibacillus proteolyticus]